MEKLAFLLLGLAVGLIAFGGAALITQIFKAVGL